MKKAVEGETPRSSVEALWLDMLRVLCDRAAHEVKGALNGVMVNVEVVRSRSTKPDVTGASLHQYAQSASGQLDAVIAMTEAMLALGAAPAPAAERCSGGAERGGARRRGGAGGRQTRRGARDGRCPWLDVRGRRRGAAGDRRGVHCRGGCVVGRGVQRDAGHGRRRALLGMQGERAGGAPSIDLAVLSLATSEGIEIQRDGPRLSITFPR